MKFKILPLFISFFLCFAASAKEQLATFAGGCFWCTESVFDDRPGVLSAISGYTDGNKQDANYKAVSSGSTKHYEAVQIKFDDTKTSYKKLLELYWRSINPTDSGGQFADRGPQYKPAVFFHNEEQKKLAQESIVTLDKAKIFRRKIVVPVLPFNNFFPAEEYHQDYHKKKPIHYKSYYYGSGRGTYLDLKWITKKDFKIFK